MQIENFHIHLYFNKESIEKAKSVAKLVSDHFVNVEVGRFHEGAVGPHPIGSVQLLVQKEDFGEALSLVALKHEGLTVFSHPNTGNNLLDHTEHAIWIGAQMSLNLERFR